MKITIELNSSDLLWHTGHENFIAEQPDRFVLLEGSHFTTGELCFCDRYLEAKFLFAFFKKKYPKIKLGLYSMEDDDGGFCVAINHKTWSKKGGKK